MKGLVFQMKVFLQYELFIINASKVMKSDLNWKVVNQGLYFV